MCVFFLLPRVKVWFLCKEQSFSDVSVTDIVLDDDEN